MWPQWTTTTTVMTDHHHDTKTTMTNHDRWWWITNEDKWGMTMTNNKWTMNNRWPWQTTNNRLPHKTILSHCSHPHLVSSSLGSARFHPPILMPPFASLYPGPVCFLPPSSVPPTWDDKDTRRRTWWGLGVWSRSWRCWRNEEQLVCYYRVIRWGHVLML